jgi:hypothetical protein
MALAIACKTYDELIGVIAFRRRELGLRQLEVDELAGCQSGWQGKIECKDRRLGKMSAPAICGVLGLELHVRAADTPVGYELLVVLRDKAIAKRAGSASGDGYAAKSRAAQIPGD